LELRGGDGRTLRPGKSSPGLDDPITISHVAVADINAWIGSVQRNEWVQQRPSTTEHRVVLRCVQLGRCLLDLDLWEHGQPETIFIHEMELALAKGAEALPPELRSSTVYATDNSALHWVVERGLSSVRRANARLNKVFGTSWPSSKWVSTLVMPADGPPRGQALPQMGSHMPDAALAAISRS
jgi:hypothetical protein